MSKKEQEEVIVDVEEVYSKTEKYIEENKNSLSIIIGAVLVVVAGYFGYKYMYVEPLEQEAQEQIWKAEQYFEQDSFRLALNGDGNYFGFLQIADNYSVTKTGNLANYYAGICYLRLGDYNNAIEYLKNFDSDDALVAPIASGAIGDAYMELGNTQEAIDFYLKAANQSKNNFTSPVYYMKAALAYETLKDYKNSADIYEILIKEFTDTKEGRMAVKYLARAKAKMSV
jgi:tetratricopeptide (TPR) repeat protein